MVVTRRSTAFGQWAADMFEIDENDAPPSSSSPASAAAQVSHNHVPVAAVVHDHVQLPQLGMPRVVSRIEPKESVPPAPMIHDVARQTPVDLQLDASARTRPVHWAPTALHKGPKTSDTDVLLREGGRVPTPLHLLPQPGRLVSTAGRRERSPGLTTDDAADGCDDLKDADSVDGGDNWKDFEVRLNAYYPWPALPNGIFDLRIGFLMRTSEGLKLRQAYLACMRFLRLREAYFKIGMASNLGTRWLMYRQPGNKWTPSHLGILMDIEGRVAAGMAESALIAMISNTDMPALYNINWKNGDKGGTGPRPEDSMYSTYYIYVAVEAASL